MKKAEGQSWKGLLHSFLKCYTCCCAEVQHLSLHSGTPGCSVSRLRSLLETDLSSPHCRCFWFSCSPRPPVHLHYSLSQGQPCPCPSGAALRLLDGNLSVIWSESLVYGRKSLLFWEVSSKIPLSCFAFLLSKMKDWKILSFSEHFRRWNGSKCTYLF